MRASCEARRVGERNTRNIPENTSCRGASLRASSWGVLTDASPSTCVVWRVRRTNRGEMNMRRILEIAHPVSRKAPPPRLH